MFTFTLMQCIYLLLSWSYPVPFDKSILAEDSADNWMERSRVYMKHLYLLEQD